jgi:FkbM family methyltransferase
MTARRDAGWRTAVARVVVVGLEYLWRITELHLRRTLPRRRHWIAMRLFQLFGRSFPVTIAHPNPLRAGARPLSICLDLCQNHELYVRARGRYEVEWMRLVGAGMEDADVFVDVGANVGVYALTVAQAFPHKRVVAVEPMPDNLEKLRRAISLNGLDNIDVVPGVVASATGRMTFHVNPLSDGAGSLVPFDAYQTGDIVRDAGQYQRRHPGFVPTVEVEAVELETLLGARSVLKIDVEGAEEAVLRSGESAFRKERVDLMVVEVQRESFAPVVRFLDEMAFDCFLLGRRLPVRADGADELPYRVGNLLCLRRGSPAYARVDFR